MSATSKAVRYPEVSPRNGNGNGYHPVPEPPAEPAVNWANSGPLCLIAFAATTFMISMVNAKGVNAAVVPVVLSCGLIFGGAVQLVGGLLQLRTGNTFNGALFSTFGGFWIVLAAYLEWFAKAVPAAQVGHTTGLLLYTFAIIAAMFLLVSFRTTIASVLALINLTVTLTLLAVGNYGGHATALQIAGITGIILAGQALYMAAAEISEYTYGRTVVPLGHLGNK
ncbi:MAG: acetate uptake transporter [Solirubrobacteraceae bacterium]